MGMRPLKCAALLLALAAAVPAQFSQLAVTDDGSQVYFVTLLRLASKDSQQGTAIFRYANGAVQRVSPVQVSSTGYVGNPQVSGGGTMFSHTSYTNCGMGGPCVTNPSTSTSYLNEALAQRLSAFSADMGGGHSLPGC